MKALLVIIMSLCLHVTYAQKTDTTKTFIQGKELGEVVVKSFKFRKFLSLLSLVHKSV